MNRLHILAATCLLAACSSPPEPTALPSGPDVKTLSNESLETYSLACYQFPGKQYALSYCLDVDKERNARTYSKTGNRVVIIGLPTIK